MGKFSSHTFMRRFGYEPRKKGPQPFRTHQHQKNETQVEPNQNKYGKRTNTTSLQRRRKTNHKGHARLDRADCKRNGADRARSVLVADLPDPIALRRADGGLRDVVRDIRSPASLLRD